MIKVFIFTVMVCSSVAQKCWSPPSSTIAFDNYKDCALFGYEYSAQFLKEYTEEQLEEQRLYLVFGCKEQKTV